MSLVVFLLLAGTLLLLAETILPGGIAGMAGLGLLVAAVMAGFQEFGASGGTWLLAGVLIGLTVGGLAWLSWLPKSRLMKPLISQSKVGGDARGTHDRWLHLDGIALTPLRPSGVARIGSEKVDVVTEGGLIPSGEPIRVVAVEGLRVVVRRIEKESASLEH